MNLNEKIVGIVYLFQHVNNKKSLLRIDFFRDRFKSLIKDINPTPKEIQEVLDHFNDFIKRWVRSGLFG